MSLNASAAFGHLLIRREHINHRAEVSIRQPRIVNPDLCVWYRNSSRGGWCVDVKIVDFEDVLSRGHASARYYKANEYQSQG
jgi:hypothetical protein